MNKISKTTAKGRWAASFTVSPAGSTGLRWVLVFLFFHIISETGAQETNYAVHANIIYRFTRYINWPEIKQRGDFVIGVVGETPLFEELEKATAGKMAGLQKIVIRRFSSSGSSFNCHILFISSEENNRLKKIAVLTAAGSTLIVTETEGSALACTCINFSIVQDKLKLEINKNNIEKRGLGIATELLQLGTIVN